MRVCAHCGEMVPGKRLNCPHCGADADQTYADDSYSADFDLDVGDLDYDRFLEREGLAEGNPDPKSRRAGCSLAAAILLTLGWILL